MNPEEKPTTQESPTPTNSFKTKLLGFLKSNMVTILSLIAILIVYIWFYVKMNKTTERFQDEKTQLITRYETERDSTTISNLEFVSMIFSWSVRSELLRDNTENLNQLITVFVKESGVDLVQIIDPKTNMVMLSSDKKFEGKEYTKRLDFEIQKSTSLKEEDVLRIVTPVMGLNDKIGVLVLEVNTAK